MLARGVKEVRDHFTKYIRRVSEGEEIVVTERGRPVAILKPVPKGLTVEERLEIASVKGLVRLPQKQGGIPSHPKFEFAGKSVTEVILEEREADKW